MGKDGRDSLLTVLPIVGTLSDMTLKEYIEAGLGDIAQIGQALGMSEHGVRKWVYGQREPDLDMAVRIEDLTGGKVTVADLSKSSARGAVKAA